MKESLSYSFAIAVTLSLASVACTPTATTTSPSPVASAKPTETASAKPTETASAKPTETPSAKPTEPKAEQSPDVVRVAVINNSGKTLTGVYMSAPSKKEWGANEIAGSPLADREKVDFEWKRSDYKGVDAGCVFDVGVEYGDGAITILDPIDLCKTPAINLK